MVRERDSGESTHEVVPLREAIEAILERAKDVLDPLAECVLELLRRRAEAGRRAVGRYVRRLVLLCGLRARDAAGAQRLHLVPPLGVALEPARV